MTGEASPRYLTDADPVEIDARLPEVKLIFLLREPVARAYSDYWMHRALGSDDRSFEDALESPGVWRRCIVTGEYHRHLRRFREVVGDDRMCVLLTDDIESDASGSFDTVCRYLGIEPVQTGPVGSVVNARVGYRSVRLRHLTPRLPSLARRVVGRINTTTLDYPPMRSDTRDRLRDHFGPHNAALASFLDRPLPW
ncbi:MAG: sulfotransferase domain-containing protein [Acidimicrobiales bacterium]|nr:sulfotransferase domain-containing protein [Acidimicrobiales bacterium]